MGRRRYLTASHQLEGSYGRLEVERQGMLSGDGDSVNGYSESGLHTADNFTLLPCGPWYCVVLFAEKLQPAVDRTLVLTRMLLLLPLYESNWRR